MKKKHGWLWWKHGVIYQIYPRSFQDSNGDGIGDIPGIIQRLDYLSDLGVDGIWLSPIYKSPMFDFGYDVSDYRAIDPAFGTMEDFKRLMKEAHRRKIRVVMDMVLNHTSHMHEWFLESRSSARNPKRDWYVWHDGINGKPPNNWKAAFGGGAWEWDAATNQFYLHSFLKEQPDVNWRNPGLRKAFYDDIKFWLDMGVDGFRLDVINWLIKDDQYRSNPFGIGPTPRPYDMQKHIHDRNRPETLGIVRELRRLMDRYGERMAVGEVFSPAPGDQALSASYYGSGNGLHLAFDFTLVFSPFKARAYMDAMERWNSLVPADCWPCVVLNNHDQPRSPGRYDGGAAMAKALAAFLLTARGTPFVYYGEELGMANGRIARREIADPVGIKYWPFNKGRDPERTPMQWDGGAFAGFSTARPWLPLNPDYGSVNVEAQSSDASSVLSFYKKLISLRKDMPALHAGSWRSIDAGPDVAAFAREYGGKTVLTVVNFSSKRAHLTMEAGISGRILLGTHQRAMALIGGGGVELWPYEALIIEE